MPRQMYSKFMFLFLIRYVRNRIDHWCTVEPGNPNPRVHRSSGKLGEASFPTGTVDPRVGISLSPLNTNDGFTLSPYMNVQYQYNAEKNWCRFPGVGPGIYFFPLTTTTSRKNTIFKIAVFREFPRLNGV